MRTSKTPLHELRLAEEVGRLLGRFGDTFLTYVTAEFSPFSDKFKPDVVFVPKVGPRAGATYFVEFRVGRERPLSERASKVLALHREFAAEGESQSFHYAFATDEEFSTVTEDSLASQGIKIFSGVTSPESLAANIAIWAEIGELP